MDKQELTLRIARYTDLSDEATEDVIRELNTLGAFEKPELYTQAEVDDLNKDHFEYGQRDGIGKAIDALEFLDNPVIDTTLRDVQRRILGGK